MFTLYILQSVSSKRRYVGVSEDIETRLRQHNAREVSSTKAYIPYKLVYTEEYDKKAEARRRELQIKKSGHLERFRPNVASSSNG